MLIENGQKCFNRVEILLIESMSIMVFLYSYPKWQLVSYRCTVKLGNSSIAGLVATSEVGIS